MHIEIIYITFITATFDMCSRHSKVGEAFALWRRSSLKVAWAQEFQKTVTLYILVRDYINATCSIYIIYKTIKGHFRLSANKRCHVGLFYLTSSLCSPKPTKPCLVLRYPKAGICSVTQLPFILRNPEAYVRSLEILFPLNRLKWANFVTSLMTFGKAFSKHNLSWGFFNLV